MILRTKPHNSQSKVFYTVEEKTKEKDITDKEKRCNGQFSNKLVKTPFFLKKKNHKLMKSLRAMT